MPFIKYFRALLRRFYLCSCIINLVGPPSSTRCLLFQQNGSKRMLKIDYTLGKYLVRQTVKGFERKKESNAHLDCIEKRYL